MINELNVQSGIITYNDFAINFDIPLKEQIFNLQQDLLQIKFGNSYILDIGWYPMFDPTGFFKIVVIKDYDWENPVLKTIVPAAEIQDFWNKLDVAIDFADNLSKSQ